MTRRESTIGRSIPHAEPPEVVALARWHRQALDQPRFTTPADVVRWFGAMQAQDYLGALWAIGLRLTDATEATVERALSNREIIRSWPLRGTLHFLPAEDARWMLEHFTPRTLKANAARLERDYDLNAAGLAKAHRLFERALEGGRSLTRDALYATLDQGGLRGGAQRGLHAVWHAAQAGVLCFGAREGKQQTFVLLDEWIGPQPKLTRDEALAKLAERYVQSHGPATATDFAWWAGLTVSDARAGLKDVTAAAATSEMPLDVDSPTARILPPFDEFTVAYRDREAVVQRWRPNRTQLGPSLLSPALAINGQIVGTWGRSLKGTSVDVKVKSEVDLSTAEHAAIGQEVARYAGYLERDLNGGAR